MLGGLRPIIVRGERERDRERVRVFERDREGGEREEIVVKSVRLC